jgi:hypothetical protein
MVDPLHRYDTGHRPAVGESTALAQAEIDGIAELTSDAVRQSPGMQCRTQACSLLDCGRT